MSRAGAASPSGGALPHQAALLSSVVAGTRFAVADLDWRPFEPPAAGACA